MKTSLWPYDDWPRRPPGTRPATSDSTPPRGRGDATRPTTRRWPHENRVNRNVIITCALTGAGDTVGRSEHVPVTPEQIAESGHRRGARRGHHRAHPRARSRRRARGRARSRSTARWSSGSAPADVDVIINTTAGMGGDLVLDPQDPTTFVEGTDLVNGVERLTHVEELHARHLHARLRQPQLRRGQPGLRQHARHAARGRQAHPGARASGARWRSSTPATCGSPTAGRGGADRRAARCSSSAWTSRTAHRPTRRCWPRWCSQLPEGRRVGVVRPRAGCRCPGWRSRCCSAATSASASRTTST